MDAHYGERTRSSRSGLQSRDAETLNWSEQEAFEDDLRQRDEERRRTDAHAGEWKRTQRMDIIATQCNEQDAALSQLRLHDAAVLP